MAIGQNKVVTMNYTLKDMQGNVIQSTDQKEPFQFLSGNQQILPKLENEIDNMIIGSKKNVKIPAPEAYGEYNDELVLAIKKEEFPEDINPEVGDQLEMQDPSGRRVPVIIKGITDEAELIDVNSPLAGKDLTFEVELVDIKK